MCHAFVGARRADDLGGAIVERRLEVAVGELLPLHAPQRGRLLEARGAALAAEAPEPAAPVGACSSAGGWAPASRGRPHDETIQARFGLAEALDADRCAERLMEYIERNWIDPFLPPSPPRAARGTPPRGSARGGAHCQNFVKITTSFWSIL